MWPNTLALCPEPAQHFSNFAAWNRSVNSSHSHMHHSNRRRQHLHHQIDQESLRADAQHCPCFGLRVNSCETHFPRFLGGAHTKESSSAYVAEKSGKPPCVTCPSFPVSHLYLSFPLPEISLQINNVLQKHLHSSLCLRLQGWENRGSHREGRLNPQKTNSPNNMLGLELCAGQTTGTCGWWLLGTDHLWQTVRAKPLSHWGELGCAQGQREVSGWCNSCGALTVIICLC